MVVAAAEVSVGLAIIVMLYRNTHSIDVNFLNRLKLTTGSGRNRIDHTYEQRITNRVADSPSCRSSDFLINGLGRNVLSKSICRFCWMHFRSGIFCHEPLGFMQVGEAIPIVRIISIL